MPLNKLESNRHGFSSPSLMMQFSMQHQQIQQQLNDSQSRVLSNNALLRKESQSLNNSTSTTTTSIVGNNAFPSSSPILASNNDPNQHTSSNVNTIPNIQSKIIALSNNNLESKKKEKFSPRRNSVHIDEGKRLTPLSSTPGTPIQLNTTSYPIPQLSHKSLKAVKNLTDRYAPKGVNTKKSLRKTSKKFLIKFVEMERKKRQLNSDEAQHVESKQILSEIEKKTKENTLLVKATRDLEEKIESVSQNLTFLEKQSQRDKQLIQFYRNRERISTNTKVQNPLLATASNFIIGGAPRQPLNNMQQAVVTLFESQGLPSDPFDLSTMTPPKGTSLKSIVYYWKVFCKISYVCRFILTKEYGNSGSNNTVENSIP